MGGFIIIVEENLIKITWKNVRQKKDPPDKTLLNNNITKSIYNVKLFLLNN